MILLISAVAMMTILVLVNNLASIIIIKHNNRKALGLQTLFDRLTNKVLITAMIFAYEFLFLGYMEIFPIPLSSSYAKICFYMNNFLYNHLLIWVISIIAFKYLTVFHPTWVDFESEDTKIARNFQVSNLAILAIIYSLEQNFLSNVEETTVYILLSGNSSQSGKTGQPNLTKCLLVTLIIAFCYTQFKIERKLSSQVNDMIVQQLNESYLNKTVLRIGLIISVLIASFTLYTVPTVELSNELHTLGTGVMLFILHFVLPQLLFIWKSNETLKKFAIDYLRRIICCKCQD